MTGRTTLLIISIVTTGLMAGLWFGWLVSVIPGLRKISDSNYISTMQNINREIINPWFVIPFMIVPLLLAGSAVAEYRVGNDRRALLLILGAVTYLAGVLGVTAGGNVPLNNELDTFDLVATDAAAHSARRSSYETPWNRWHNLRTGANLLAFVFAATAATISEGEG